MIFEYTSNKKSSCTMNSMPAKTISLEQLEPRILLSAESLLNITPAPLQDTILNNTQQEIQYAELQDTNEQVEEQISMEVAQPVNPDIESYKPILTLCIDDNGNEESIDEDLSISNVGSAQVNNDVVFTLE